LRAAAAVGGDLPKGLMVLARARRQGQRAALNSLFGPFSAKFNPAGESARNTHVHAYAFEEGQNAKQREREKERVVAESGGGCWSEGRAACQNPPRAQPLTCPTLLGSRHRRAWRLFLCVAFHRNDFNQHTIAPADKGKKMFWHTRVEGACDCLYC